MNKIEIEDPDMIVHPDEKDGEGTRFAPCTRCGTSIWYDDSEPVICAECAAFLRGLAYARQHVRIVPESSALQEAKERVVQVAMADYDSLSPRSRELFLKEPDGGTIGRLVKACAVLESARKEAKEGGR